MKASKTENSFETGFQQSKSGLQKKPVLTCLILWSCYEEMQRLCGGKLIKPVSTSRLRGCGNQRTAWIIIIVIIKIKFLVHMFSHIVAIIKIIKRFYLCKT